jgi:hypothetical protein
MYSSVCQNILDLQLESTLERLLYATRETLIIVIALWSKNNKNKYMTLAEYSKSKLVLCLSTHWSDLKKVTECANIMKTQEY